MSVNGVRVSIVLPVYNGADYLADAIDSALNQIYDNIEIIVVNDGSTDNGATERIARQYGEKIRYFEKSNGGVASALNFGINKMTGEYFSWLSHDDIYLSHKISAQMEFINRFEATEAVIYADYTQIDSKGNIIQEIHLPPISPSNMFEYLYNYHEMHGCTLLIPRQIFANEGFFSEQYKTTQDYDYWMQICKKYPFLKMNDIVLLARQHAKQGSRVIASHHNEVRAFYARHLPGLIEQNNRCVYRVDEGELLFQQIERHLRQANKCAAWDTFSYALSVIDSKKNKILFINQALFALFKSYCPKAIGPFYTKLEGCFQRGGRSKTTKPSFKSGCLDFTDIYFNNGFGGMESASGAGSTLFQTRIIRREIPLLISKLKVRSLLDLPCGDFHWMQHVKLIGVNYIGCDIVIDLVKRNQAIYGMDGRQFKQMNLIADKLPQVDLVFCRDCLVHLSFSDVNAALNNVKLSGSKWLLTTTFTERSFNDDLNGGVWRPINLQIAPFNLPEPLFLINECCTEGGGNFWDKCLGLWRINDLPTF